MEWRDKTKEEYWQGKDDEWGKKWMRKKRKQKSCEAECGLI